jgi:hypothetical protein
MGGRSKATKAAENKEKLALLTHHKPPDPARTKEKTVERTVERSS